MRHFAPLVTPQTPETSTVANSTRGLIDTGFAVCILKTRDVTWRLEVRRFGVTLLATERVFNLVVAHKAVGHLRHVEFGHSIRL